MAPTTYLWQHHLRLTAEDRHGEASQGIAPQVQEFIDSGAMGRLLAELQATERNPTTLFQVILQHLERLESNKRPAVARYVYHSTWGQGVIREAAEMALRWVT